VASSVITPRIWPHRSLADGLPLTSGVPVTFTVAVAGAWRFTARLKTSGCGGTLATAFLRPDASVAYSTDSPDDVAVSDGVETDTGEVSCAGQNRIRLTFTPDDDGTLDYCDVMSYSPQSAGQRAALAEEAVTVLTPAESVAALVSDLGGDAGVLAIYDSRLGMTVTSSALEQWDDARGDTGFGPSLVQATAADRLAVTDEGTDDALVVLTDADWIDGGAAVSGWNLATVKCVVVIGTFENPGARAHVTVVAEAGGPYLRTATSSSTAGGSWSDGTNVRFNSSGVAISTDRLVMVVTYDGDDGTVQALNASVVTRVMPLTPAQDVDMGLAVNSTTIGSATTSSNAGSIRAILVLSFIPDATQRAALLAFGTADHEAITAS
jgi:hypothetical protein